MPAVRPDVAATASGMRDAGIDPTNFTISKPTIMGRLAQAATLGAYDPTHGVDSGKFGPGIGKTKFGAFMDFLRPALEGAAIGGLTGRSHPGGGFGGANEFFLNQRLRQMQMGQYLMGLQRMQTEMAKTQSDIQKNSAETGYYNRGGPVRQAQPVIGDNGNYWEMDPVTRKLTDTGVKAQQKDNSKPVMTDQGLVTVSGGKATPVRLADSTPSGTTKTEDAEQPEAGADSDGLIPPRTGVPIPQLSSQGSPAQSPEGIRTSAPLHAPSFGKPKVAKVTNRNASGAETDSLIDENPNSPTYGKTLKPNVASRAPLPDRSEKRTTAKNDDVSRAEQYAQAAMDKMGNDPDKALEHLNSLKITDPKAAKDFERLLPQIRKAIRDRVKPGRTGKKPRITPDQAKQMGLGPTANSSITGTEEGEEDNEE